MSNEFILNNFFIHFQGTPPRGQSPYPPAPSQQPPPGAYPPGPPNQPPQSQSPGGPPPSQQYPYPQRYSTPPGTQQAPNHRSAYPPHQVSKLSKQHKFHLIQTTRPTDYLNYTFTIILLGANLMKHSFFNLFCLYLAQELSVSM